MPLYSTPSIGVEFFPQMVTAGTSQTAGQFSLYVGEIVVPQPATLTGLKVLNGATVNGNLKSALFDLSGTLLTQSASTAQSGTNAVQAVDFTAAYPVQAGGYLIGIISDSATSTLFQQFPISRSKLIANGSFTLANITAPTQKATSSSLASMCTY